MTLHTTYLPPHLAALFAHARTDFRPLRSIAAREIERLIDFLDALDGDTDLEADAYHSDFDDEGRLIHIGVSSDYEASLCGVSVGLPSGPINLASCGGDPYDLEADDADAEDGGDDEPSLCGLVVSAPSAGGDDREDGDDNGIADEGGRAEQCGHVWFGCIQELSSIDGRPLCWRDGQLVSEAFA